MQKNEKERHKVRLIEEEMKRISHNKANALGLPKSAPLVPRYAAFWQPVICGVRSTSPMHPKTAIQSFIAYCEQSGTVLEYKELTLLLDQLIWAYHSHGADSDSTDYPDPEAPDYADCRAVIQDRFPDLGFYSMVLDTTDADPNTQVGLEDALDDITDIYRDMWSIRWRYTNNSDQNALWHFRFGHDAHWGAHARSLLYHLHSLNT